MSGFNENIGCRATISTILYRTEMSEIVTDDTGHVIIIPPVVIV